MRTSAKRDGGGKTDMRQAILEAAKDLIANERSKDLSMRRIAEKIGCSAGALYLHFKDKEAILGSLSEEGFEALCSRMEQTKAPDPLERLRQAAGAYLNFAVGHPHTYRIMLGIADNPVELDLKGKQPASRRAFEALLGMVRQAVAADYLSAQIDDVVATHILWAQMHGAVSLALCGRLGFLPKAERQAFFDAAVDSALCGISPCCDP